MRHHSGSGRNPAPSIVTTLLVLNGLIFLLEGTTQSFLLQWFALWPLGSAEPFLGGSTYVPRFWPWQLVSYAFLHANLMHLFFNMFALWMFGREMEGVWGAKRFLTYYFVCVIGAAVVQLFVSSLAARQGNVFPTLGASGATFGLLLAFGMTFPERIVVLLFPPIPMKAKWLVIGYGALELWAGVTGTAAGIAHFAHLGGMLFGYLLLRYWRGPRLERG